MCAWRLFRIHCSSECRDILVKLGGYELTVRGVTSMKGKGDQVTYWLVGESAEIKKKYVHACAGQLS